MPQVHSGPFRHVDIGLLLFPDNFISVLFKISVLFHCFVFLFQGLWFSMWLIFLVRLSYLACFFSFLTFVFILLSVFNFLVSFIILSVSSIHWASYNAEFISAGFCMLLCFVFFPSIGFLSLVDSHIHLPVFYWLLLWVFEFLIWGFSYVYKCFFNNTKFKLEYCGLFFFFMVF